MSVRYLKTAARQSPLKSDFGQHTHRSERTLPCLLWKGWKRSAAEEEFRNQKQDLSKRTGII